MRGGSNQLLTPGQAAAFLAVPLSTLYSNWRRWGVPAYRVGKHLRFRERDLEAWLSRQVVR
ncbi:helix-turn-helix domain-containing protein [Streptantibioticus rubrisoli]|uniref:Helix-turn-helix domain-containing protein n=1 Tax=Streptantibioticus rubrisoli TaxID=1387313 RepID=A0ABT1P9E0_9ACTN|nr:helix-turn-helix domain-containing protein [Streptantibioticus rubrisoli]MCQ4041994.1 helix-turn-helix domain-containing protein [Streptantibioticus rubrisoli]